MSIGYEDLKPQDENQLSSHINRGLSSWVDQKFGASSLAHSSHQALASLPTKEVFADIVQRLGDCCVLMLEVKTQETRRVNGQAVHRFQSFERQQRAIYVALSRFRMPIYYCYNIAEQNQQHLRGNDILRANKVSEPDVVCDEAGTIVDFDNHDTLLKLVEDLVAGAKGKEGALCEALFPYVAGPTESDIGIRRLLLAYNATTSSLEIFDEEHVQVLVAAVRTFVRTEMSVNSLDGLTVNEMVAVFSDYVRAFQDTVNGLFSDVTSASNAPGPDEDDGIKLTSVP